MLKNHHRQIYYFGLILLSISLPLSMFLLSVAQIILLANWLLERNFRQKLELALKRKSVFAFVIIYLIHVLAMAYSTDYAYGFHDLKIKLPLLILPVIIGTTEPVNLKQFRVILLWFCGAVLISTIISTGKLFGWWGTPVLDVRDISIFISHIRLALMINMAIFALAWMKQKSKLLLFNSGIILLMLWLTAFLVILKSLTGILIFLVLVAFFIIRWALQKQNPMLKWFVVVGALSAFLLITAYISNSISRFYHIENVDKNNLDSLTRNGNPYSHDISSKDSENGNYTWLYVCEKELETEWNKRSSLDFKGKDLKGQELRYTLIRYLTSRGFRKDSIGTTSLTPKDIYNIEKGMANYIYSEKFSFYPRIYQLLWEVNQYKNGGNPSGHSFTQRLEYLKTASHIIKDNFWIGVGTGDVAKEFQNQYKIDNSQLDLRWQLRAHNQFITFLLTFGIIGFLIIVAALLYPVFKENKWNSYFVLLFLIIGFLSFLNEDTLETHAGISFFAFFYAFFLYNSQVADDSTK